MIPRLKAKKEKDYLRSYLAKKDYIVKIPRKDIELFLVRLSDKDGKLGHWADEQKLASLSRKQTLEFDTRTNTLTHTYEEDLSKKIESKSIQVKGKKSQKDLEDVFSVLLHDKIIFG